MVRNELNQALQMVSPRTSRDVLEHRAGPRELVAHLASFVTGEGHFGDALLEGVPPPRSGRSSFVHAIGAMARRTLLSFI